MAGQAGQENTTGARKRRAGSTLLIVATLVSIAVLFVLSATNTENDEQRAAEPSVAVTDTTAAAGSDGSSTRGMPVTDTTTAPAPQDSATRSTTTTTSAPTTTTQPASTTTVAAMDRFQRRASHPAWDDRLPSTSKGLRATACHNTFLYSLFYTPTWEYWSSGLGHKHYAVAQDELIGTALDNPTWEPTPGTDLHDALADFGVSSAQDIRDMGEEIEVRFYAWWVLDMINWLGNPTHPDCASIIAGANAVLTPYQTTTTTTATRVLNAFERRASHPAWDDRLPSTSKGLRATACHDTFEYELFYTPRSWTYWYIRTHTYAGAHDELIATALDDPTWEPTPGTDLHAKLAEFGVSSAQDIRDMGDELEVRFYAWWVRRVIGWLGDPTDPDCASILAGANAVLTPYQTTTTTTTP